MSVLNFKNYYLIFMMTILSSCIEVNHRTPLVDKSQSEDVTFFDSDSTVMYLSGHMKEWNKFWGIINMDDTPKESDYLELYVQVHNDCKPILIERFKIQVELLKNGELICLENGYIYWADDVYAKKNPVSLNDSLNNNSYPNVESYCDPYLYTIMSEDKLLIGCDTLIVKPDIKFTINNNKYHIQRTDTLYRIVEKKTRFIHF